MKKLLSKSQTLGLSLLLALTIFAQAAPMMPHSGHKNMPHQKAAPVPVTCPGEPAGDVCT